MKQDVTKSTVLLASFVKITPRHRHAPSSQMQYAAEARRSIGHASIFPSRPNAGSQTFSPANLQPRDNVCIDNICFNVIM